MPQEQLKWDSEKDFDSAFKLKSGEKSFGTPPGIKKLLLGKEDRSRMLGGAQDSSKLWSRSFENHNNEECFLMIKSISVLLISSAYQKGDGAAEEEINGLNLLADLEDRPEGMLEYLLYKGASFFHMVAPLASGDLKDLSQDIFIGRRKIDINQQFLPAMAKVKAGLDWLGKKGLVHRDVKPENILYFVNVTSGQMFFKLTDFGFLETIEKVQIKRSTSWWLSIRGTPGYIPPKSLPILQIDYYCFYLTVLDFLEMSSHRRKWESRIGRGWSFNPDEVRQAIEALKSVYPNFSNMLEGVTDQQAAQARAAAALVTARAAAEALVTAPAAALVTARAAEALVTAPAPATVEIKDTQTLKRSALVMGLLVIGLMVAMAVTAGVGLLGAACVLAGVAALTAGSAAQLAAESTVTLKPSSP